MASSQRRKVIAVIYTHHHWPEGRAVTIGNPLGDDSETLPYLGPQFTTARQTPYLAEAVLLERSDDPPAPFDVSGCDYSVSLHAVASVKPLNWTQAKAWEEQHGMAGVYTEHGRGVASAA